MSTELVEYNIHDSVISQNTQFRTDCHSFVITNCGNSRVYLNNTNRLDPGATFVSAPAPINIICRKIYTTSFNDMPGVTYSSSNPREDRLEISKTVINHPNFL